MGRFLKFLSTLFMILVTLVCVVVSVDAGVLEAYLSMAVVWVCAVLVALPIRGTGVALLDITELKKENALLNEKLNSLLQAQAGGTAADAAPAEAEAAQPEEAAAIPAKAAAAASAAIAVSAAIDVPTVIAVPAAAAAPAAAAVPAAPAAEPVPEAPAAEPVPETPEKIEEPPVPAVKSAPAPAEKEPGKRRLRMPLAAVALGLSVVFRLFTCTELCWELFGFRSYLGGILSLTSFSLLVSAALCGILFAKQRNIVLVSALGAQTLLQFIQCFPHFPVVSLLYFAAYALLFVFALVYCEPPILKAGLSKLKSLTDRLFFLPAAIHLASFTYLYIVVSRTPDTFMPFSSIINALLDCAVLLLIPLWLKDPYRKAAVKQPAAAAGESSASAAEEYPEAYCGMGKHILLSLFTFGIWYLIWTYRTTRYLNRAPGAVQYSPTKKLLLCMFVPFYSIYWFYKHGQRIDSLCRQKKLSNSDMATLCLILGIFIPIVASILMQDRINQLCTAKAGGETAAAESSAAAQLKEYKDLLDSGVLTQEEFDTKKKQLLGL